MQIKISAYSNTINAKIEGEESKVQLDESYFGKRKYNVGRTLSYRWVFGGIDVATKKFFMKVIPDKTSLTLGNFIKEHIECGTTVHTDQFSSYFLFLVIIQTTIMEMLITNTTL